MMGRGQGHVVAAGLLAVGTLVGGCSGDPVVRDDPTPRVSGAPATKQGTGEVRHDLAPLTSRFPVLGTPTAATWLSGRLGGSDVGPSSYWIDAVVSVTPDVARRLLDTAPSSTSTRPDVVPALAPVVPGELRGGPALDALFAEGGYRATAWVSADGATLVLVARGQ